MTINKVIITFLSVLFSAALLSLNFMTVASGDVSGDVYQDIQLVQERSEVLILDRGFLKYARVSPEVSYLNKTVPEGALNSSTDELARTRESNAGQQLDPGRNFGFRKIQVSIEGNTISLQTVGSRSLVNNLTPSAAAIPLLERELSLRQDYYLDDPGLHYPAENSLATLTQGMDQAIPVIEIHYDREGDYDARKTWVNVDPVDMLARAMLAEENEKLFDPEREIDFVGAGWVMVNRTSKPGGFFIYADENLYGALVPYFQFALGGVKDLNGTILPGNAAIVANPELYPGWFAGEPRRYYQRAYDIAVGILNGTIPDPTDGAIYFADFYIMEDGSTAPFEDGRTRFWYQGYPSFSIPELQLRESVPWASH